MATYTVPEHLWEMEIPLDTDGDTLRRLLRVSAVAPAETVIDLSELMKRLPCKVTRYSGFVPLNGDGYLVDSDRCVVHLDIETQQFWVTEKEAHG